MCDGGGGGQVKCLTVEERVLYARLIVALADRDSLNIVAVYKAMGVRTKHNNPTVLEAWATILNDRDDAEVLEGFTFQVSLRCNSSLGGVCSASRSKPKDTSAPSELQGCQPRSGDSGGLSRCSLSRRSLSRCLLVCSMC